MAKVRMAQGGSAPVAWESLARKAIERANRAGDSRVRMLEAALASGKAPQVLKRLGIIGESDLSREFPIKGT